MGPDLRSRGKTVNFDVKKLRDGGLSDTFDDVVTEEPLEIRVYYRAKGNEDAYQSVSVTMRTPGNDFELAAGFLFSEGVLSSKDDIARIVYCVEVDEEQQYNIVNVHLNPWVKYDPVSLSRNFYATSSCGVCGKATLDALRLKGYSILKDDSMAVPVETIIELPERLRNAQAVFNKTGGLHAAGLFDTSGKLEVLREDVGRHNAVDKLIGSQLLAGRVPMRNKICAVSGRIGFELVQKILVAGVPMMVAVGAPSSLAVDLAREFNMTIVGFVRGRGLNIYSGEGRVLHSETSSMTRPN